MSNGGAAPSSQLSIDEDELPSDSVRQRDIP